MMSMRVLSLAKEADRTIARLVVAMNEAGFAEAGVNVVAMSRQTLAFYVPEIIQRELPQASVRERTAANVIDIASLLNQRGR
jgi:hypothetical protein